MYDMKPQAPIEYRGEFNPIRTNVVGMEVCELMPLQARIADKFAILRGAQLANLHTGNMFYSGYAWQESPRASVPGEAQRPALGSIVSRLRPGAADIPPYVSIENALDWERAYYAGVEHEPVRVGSSSAREAIDNMGRHASVSPDRLVDRYDLLAAFDRTRRDFEYGPTARKIDSFRRGRWRSSLPRASATPSTWARRSPRHARDTVKRGIATGRTPADRCCWLAG